MQPPSRITSARTAGPLVRAAVVLGLSLVYFSSAFQIFKDGFWTAGMGDWMDPYFINSLLEHWSWSFTHFHNPLSPTMFFPQEKTLGYSHGLVLYALIYVPLRVLFHPFQAYNLTLFAVMVGGTVSLYALLRMHFRLAFVESLLLTAFFATSANVVNVAINAWSQRASIYLVPPVLLLLVVSSRMRDGWARLVVACVAGLMASLMFVQDFYTAHFTLFFVALFLAAYVVVERAWPRQLIAGSAWPPRSQTLQRIAIATATLAIAWALYVGLSGGNEVSILGLRVRSHNWRRPGVLGLLALLAYFLLRGGIRVTTPEPRISRWLGAALIGAAAGAGVFLWIYLPAYWQFGSFPEDNLANALKFRDPARWRNVADFFRDVQVSDTMRPYVLVVVTGLLTWVPWLNRDRSARRYSLWFALVSLLVLLVPISFGGFSVWRSFFVPLPGFKAIRDPARIIYSYELATVLAIALIVSRRSVKPVFRICIAATLLVLLVAKHNDATLRYQRSNQVFRRWVTAPIEIHPSCASFFVKHGSPTYAARNENKWTLYNLDAFFISLRHSIPTLNGYSAWVPEGWQLLDPEERPYLDYVNRWIHQNALTGVCELDLDARMMMPYHVGSS